MIGRRPCHVLLPCEFCVVRCQLIRKEPLNGTRNKIAATLHLRKKRVRGFCGPGMSARHRNHGVRLRHVPTRFHVRDNVGVARSNHRGRIPSRVGNNFLFSFQRQSADRDPKCRRPVCLRSKTFVSPDSPGRRFNPDATSSRCSASSQDRWHRACRSQVVADNPMTSW